jgi:hypothetical protein
MSEYEHPFFDEKGRVICQLCGKPFLVISPRHLSSNHSIKYAEYKLRFPDAPLSSEEFNASSKYGKEKQVFVKEELEKIDELPEDMGEEIEVVEPEIEEEIDFSKMLNEKKSNDICCNSKDQVLDLLRAYFTNVKKDYMIRQEVAGRIVFEFITDFCDPVLKIVIQFPKTFWHNKEAYIDPNKNLKLEQHGWKIVEITANPPRIQDISSALERL